MKLDELYESILEEGLSSRVYHATTSRVLMKIINSNEFILSSALNNPNELVHTGGRGFFLSTARTKNSSYVYNVLIDNPSTGWDIPIIMHLDGRLLGSNYKAGAVDYNSARRVDDTGSNYITKKQHDDESEDRIYSDKNTIPNAKRYITHVDIYFRYPLRRELAQLLKTLERNRISYTWYYQSVFGVMTSNKSESHTETDVKNALSSQYTNTPDEDIGTTVDKAEDEDILRYQVLATLIKMDGRKLSSSEMSVVNDHYRLWKREQQIYGKIKFNNEVLRNPKAQKSLQIISRAMRSDGYTNISTYTEYLLNRRGMII